VGAGRGEQMILGKWRISGRVTPLFELWRKIG
jgi:hypothetical protein